MAGIVTAGVDIESIVSLLHYLPFQSQVLRSIRSIPVSMHGKLNQFSGWFCLMLGFTGNGERFVKQNSKLCSGWAPHTVYSLEVHILLDL